MEGWKVSDRPKRENLMVNFWGLVGVGEVKEVRRNFRGYAARWEDFEGSYGG